MAKLCRHRKPSFFIVQRCIIDIHFESEHFRIKSSDIKIHRLHNELQSDFIKGNQTQKENFQASTQNN